MKCISITGWQHCIRFSLTAFLLPVQSVPISRTFVLSSHFLHDNFRVRLFRAFFFLSRRMLSLIPLSRAITFSGSALFGWCDKNVTEKNIPSAHQIFISNARTKNVGCQTCGYKQKTKEMRRTNNKIFIFHKI